MLIFSMKCKSIINTHKKNHNYIHLYDCREKRPIKRPVVSETTFTGRSVSAELLSLRLTMCQIPSVCSHARPILIEHKVVVFMEDNSSNVWVLL